MSKASWLDCRRCDGPFIEQEKEGERRRFMGEKILCDGCKDEIKEEAIRRGLGPLYYVGTTEPCIV